MSIGHDCRFAISTTTSSAAQSTMQTSDQAGEQTVAPLPCFVVSAMGNGRAGFATIVNSGASCRFVNSGLLLHVYWTRCMKTCKAHAPHIDVVFAGHRLKKILWRRDLNFPFVAGLDGKKDDA